MFTEIIGQIKVCGAGVERNQIISSPHKYGPAQFAATNLTGTVPLSKMRSSEQYGIGTSTRDREASRYTPGKLNGGYARATPGPQYQFEESLNKQASHIWGYLSMTFTSMGRPDLVAKAQSGVSHEVFRADFDF